MAAAQIDKIDSETKKKMKAEERKEFYSYYLQQRKVILSILISMYVVLNVIASILTTYYHFVNLFLYIGIIMIVIILGIIVTIVYEGDLFWAFLGSFFVGVVPTIELIIGLAIAPLEGVNLALVIISLILSVCLIFAPSILVYYISKRGKMDKKKEQE